MLLSIAHNQNIALDLSSNLLLHCSILHSVFCIFSVKYSFIPLVIYTYFPMLTFSLFHINYFSLQVLFLYTCFSWSFQYLTAFLYDFLKIVIHIQLVVFSLQVRYEKKENLNLCLHDIRSLQPMGQSLSGHCTASCLHCHSLQIFLFHTEK